MFDLEGKQGFREKMIFSFSGFGLLSLLICSYLIGSSYLSVSGYGDWGLLGQELVSWFALLGLVIMLISLAGEFEGPAGELSRRAHCQRR